MTPEQFQRIRTGLGLTQAALAERLSVDRVTGARYETGTRRIPEMAARLLLRIREDTPKRKGRR